MTGPIVPYSVLDSQNPKAFWQFLAEYEKSFCSSAKQSLSIACLVH